MKQQLNSIYYNIKTDKIAFVLPVEKSHVCRLFFTGNSVYDHDTYGTSKRGQWSAYKDGWRFICKADTRILNEKTS